MYINFDLRDDDYLDAERLLADLADAMPRVLGPNNGSRQRYCG